MTLSRIVVGDDGSAGAAAARAWAKTLAEASAADLVSVTIEEEQDGSASAGVLQHARHAHADLIAVGRRGAGGFPTLRLGGTAHQIAEHASTPVVVVPAVEGAHRHGWPFSHAAVGVNGSPAAAAAAAWAASFAAAATAQVLAVHALNLGAVFAAAGFDENAYESATRATSEVMEREWCAPLRDAGVGYRRLLADGGAAAVLLEAVRAHSIDLLVVGRRDSVETSVPSMGSVAHRAIAFSPCPTVVIPAVGSWGGPLGAR